MLTRQMALRFAAGMCTCVLFLYINNLSQVYIERSYLQHALRTPLFDLGFEFLPIIPYPLVPDFMAGSLLLVVVAGFSVFHPKGTQIFRRFIILAGCMFLARAFTIIATILPNPERTCKTDAIAGSKDENVFYEALRILLRTRVTCGDCLFSAHTALTNLAGLSATLYGRHFIPNETAWKIIRTLIWVYCSCTYILIVCTRFHYTIDVTIGVMVSTAIWKWYHSYISYLDELPQWHPIVWYEFDYNELENEIDGEHDTEVVKLSKRGSQITSLDDPEAPLLLSFSFQGNVKHDSSAL